MLRIALSPSGEMHLESLRAALITYIIAGERNEPLLVRIDDADSEAVIEGKDTELMQILEKFSIRHDQVYHQSEHRNIHITLALRLLEEDKAFLCTCPISKDDTQGCSGNCAETVHDYSALKKSGTTFVIRMREPRSPIITKDHFHGTQTTMPEAVGSFIILDEKAAPTPLFASACDDMLSNITLIIRKASLLEQMPKEAYIKKALGYEMQTHYAHLPALLTKEGKALESSSGDTGLLALFKEGFIPDAIINYLLLLGYPDAPQEVFTLPDALTWYDYTRLSHKPVTFDMERLRRLNRAHLERMDDKQLSALFGFADADIGKLAKRYLEEASTLRELEAKIRLIFSPKTPDDSLKESVETLREIIWNAPMIDSYEAFKSYLIKESGLEESTLEATLRVLLTGTTEGPDLDSIYPHIKSYLLEVIS